MINSPNFYLKVLPVSKTKLFFGNYLINELALIGFTVWTTRKSFPAKLRGFDIGKIAKHFG
jgi:hypothetical protein